MLRDEDLLHGDPDEVAAFLGVTRRTLNRYKKDPASMPEACRKLLRLRLEGDLRALGGDAWEGFYLQSGKLYAPFWERQIGPEAIKSMYFQIQEAAALRNEVRRLRLELWALRKIQALKVLPVPPVKLLRRKA